ncbi:MAG: glycosyltransferase family 2 protein [Bacteroidota bacterium]
MEIVDISIIIVNYNVKEFLIPCLRSIYASEIGLIKLEVIVIDNNSTDNSVEIVVTEFPQVIIIRNNYNAGFPKANNQGFEIAKGRYIFMLNPDTELLDNALTKLYHFIENNSDISLIAPQLLNSNLTFQSSVWRYPSLWYIFCETHYLKWFLRRKNYLDIDLNNPFLAESFSGAAIMFNRLVFEKIGMLDETMFWIEDIDFCYRANKEGMRLLYYPYAQIKHHIGQSAKKNYNVSISNQIVNKIKFFKKHYGNLQLKLVTIISVYEVLIKLLVFGILFPFNKVYNKKAKAYFHTLPLVFNPHRDIK